jgi:hypothetical protein
VAARRWPSSRSYSNRSIAPAIELQPMRRKQGGVAPAEEADGLRDAGRLSHSLRNDVDPAGADPQPFDNV